MRKRQSFECPYCPECINQHRFMHPPRLTGSIFDETVLLPIAAPKANSSDFAACERLHERLEWLAHDLEANAAIAHPAIVEAFIRPIVDFAAHIRGTRYRCSLPRYQHFDTRDPIFIFWQNCAELLDLAEGAMRAGGLLDPDQLAYLSCRTAAALDLKEYCGVDVRYDLLEVFLEIVDRLILAEGPMWHVTL